jgi:hypothetical protein
MRSVPFFNYPALFTSQETEFQRIFSDVGRRVRVHALRMTSTAGPRETAPGFAQITPKPRCRIKAPRRPTAAHDRNEHLLLVREQAGVIEERNGTG